MGSPPYIVLAVDTVHGKCKNDGGLCSLTR